MSPYQSQSFDNRRRSDAIPSPKKFGRPKSRQRIPPHPPKPCHVFYQGVPMDWNPEHKLLVATGKAHLFTSRGKARNAIFHTLQRQAAHLRGDELVKYEMVSIQ